jgi:alkanesulfonate monooxygenase SsuD/methylene tetrahydromethanopterin reductase-like flavin-dependent oxidoreductase (luciferase family)
VSPYTMIPNPINLLSFFAGATKKVDLGTMVVVLPWHHPLRVAEDITMLQYMLGGRTPYIGFGRGLAMREFRQLGFDMNESRDRFAESVEIIKLAITQETFTYKGQFWTFENITMRPRPLDPQAIIDNLCLSWGSPSSAPVGARLGLRPLIIPQRAWPEYHEDLAAYSAARKESGYEPVRPRIHLHVFVGETEDEAYEGASRYMPEYGLSAANNYQFTSGHFADTKGYEHYAAMASQIKPEALGQMMLANHVWGTPEQCLAKLEGIAEAFHPDEFMPVFRYGSMSQEVAEKSIDLFAREVLPGLQETPVEPPITYEADRPSS